MQQPDDRAPAPPIDVDEPSPNTWRTVLIVSAAVLALVIGVMLHLTGIIGPG